MLRAHLKVYAAFFPADANVLSAVEKAGREAMGHESPWLFLEGNMLRIAWEGVYFPLEEVLRALADTLAHNAEGKLDYLDLEDWTLTRYLPRAGGFHASTRGLNQVLEYSGH